LTILSFFWILSLLGAVTYLFAAGNVLTHAWILAPMVIGGFLLLSAVYMIGLLVISSFIKFEPLKKQKAFYRWACVGVAEVLTGYARVKTKVSGMEYIPTDKRFLLVCNHRSGFDPLVMYAKLKKYNIAFISKPENMKIPLAGKLSYAAGALPINRENDREAMKTILQAADYINRDLCSMCVFPEGTRSKTQELLPFHAGSFKIAQRANVPVVIASIQGTEKVHTNFPFRSTKAELHILQVISSETVKSMKTTELAELSKNMIENDLRRVFDE